MTHEKKAVKMRTETMTDMMRGLVMIGTMAVIDATTKKGIMEKDMEMNMTKRKMFHQDRVAVAIKNSPLLPFVRKSSRRTKLGSVIA
jgi:hypothetical protein